MAFVADRRLYLTADQQRVVEAHDPAAAFLWAAPGDPVSAADAERFGLVSAGGPTPVVPSASAEPAVPTTETPAPRRRPEKRRKAR